MSQEGSQYAAAIEGYSMRIQDGKAPYLILNFVYDDNGQGKRINYLGSLSKAAYPYTLERLQTIGYAGKLKSYEEIAEWIEGRAEFQKENLTIVISDEEFKGKTRKKVKWFFGTPKPLTDDEKEKLTAAVFKFMNGGAAPTRPKPAAKPVQQALPSVDADEEIPF